MRTHGVVLAVALAAVSLVGCPRAADRRADDAGATTPVDGAAPAGASAAAPPTCADLSRSFRTTWKQAPGTCGADTECACYNPVVEEAGCGGVTDRATASSLAKIEAAFHAASCPWPHMCAAQACNPQCVTGRCVNRERAP
jgi:hypothetical protein